MLTYIYYITYTYIAIYYYTYYYIATVYLHIMRLSIE